MRLPDTRSMCEALLIIEVEGSETEIAVLLNRIAEIAARVLAEVGGDQLGRRSKRAHLGRPQGSVRGGRADIRLLLHGRHDSARAAAARFDAHRPRFAAGYGLKVANIFHAGDGNLHPLILYDANSPDQAHKAEQAGADILRLCVEVGGCLTGEHGVGIEKRDLMTVQFTATDSGRPDAHQDSVRSAVAAQSGEGLSARGECWSRLWFGQWYFRRSATRAA